MLPALKILPLFLLLILAGCDRSAVETQQVETAEEVAEVAETPVVAETAEAVEEIPEPAEAPQDEAEVESHMEPDIVLEDIPPLAPLPWLVDNAPDPGTPELVHFVTDRGEFVLAVYPQAAPNAVERFLHLVDIGFYDNTPVSRVVPGFVAQFGINWRDGMREWRDSKFDDDPTLFAFEAGTIAFAKAGPNTNSTQVFINYTNNNRLADPQYNFAVFGQVVQGMDVVQGFIPVGDRSGGLDQGELWENGEQYLDALADLPNMVLDAHRIR